MITHFLRQFVFLQNLSVVSLCLFSCLTLSSWRLGDLVDTLEALISSRSSLLTLFDAMQGCCSNLCSLQYLSLVPGLIVIVVWLAGNCLTPDSSAAQIWWWAEENQSDPWEIDLFLYLSFLHQIPGHSCILPGHTWRISRYFYRRGRGERWGWMRNHFSDWKGLMHNEQVLMLTH